MNIYDELNTVFDPYFVLGITENSNSETIKEAYKIKKQGVSPSKKIIIEDAYNMIKSEKLRIRYSLLKNRPFNSLDDIKDLGISPKKIETSYWFSLITKD